MLAVWDFMGPHTILVSASILTSAFDCCRQGGGYVYYDLDDKHREQIPPRQGRRRFDMPLNRIFCMGTMDMLFIMWMLRRPPEIPMIQQLCRELVQDFDCLLADKATTLMCTLAKVIHHGQIKGMMISTIRPGLARVLPILVSSSHDFSAWHANPELQPHDALSHRLCHLSVLLMP